jgi:hypothetical protein
MFEAIHRGYLNLLLKFLMKRAISMNSNRLLLCGLVMIASTGQTLAALGQSPTLSIAPSLMQSQTSSKKMTLAPVTLSGLYTLQESQLENGTVVREFTTPEGVVFAVGWVGPVLPDLSDLLGNYFEAFKLEVDQARTTGRRGAPVNIHRDDLIVRSNGRMHHFFGHAYAPSLVPAGVSVNDLLQ